MDIKQSKNIKQFADARILHGIDFDEDNNQILFDYTLLHYRNIASVDLTDYSVQDVIANTNIDERDISTSFGQRYYSSDVNGIFNLAYQDSNGANYITNVKGGGIYAQWK